MAVLWRYYQAGAVNTLVGFGLYALFVRLGLNQYLAQIIAHVLGVAFNYFTYSRHVFRDVGSSKLRFALAYVFNYLIGLGSLATVSQFVHSPYLAGAIAVLFASVINYFVLRYTVFVRRAA